MSYTSVRVGTLLRITCDECGALVDHRTTDKHDRFHDRLAALEQRAEHEREIKAGDDW